MTDAITLKRGDSFRLECTLLSGGEPVDITGWQIDSHVRNAGGRLVQRLALTVVDVLGGAYTLGANTAAWPTGTLRMDVRYVDAIGVVVHTRDVLIIVLEAVTP